MAPAVAALSKEARMTASRIRSLLAGVAGAALMLAPALAASADNGGSAAPARNLTEEQQQSGAIPLPSLAPLAQRVLPAVVNISVELNQQTAMQDLSGEDQGSSGDSGLPQQPGGTPFDQFLRRFFSKPVYRAEPRPARGRTRIRVYHRSARLHCHQ
jgi:S1-C subfamily serine protease